jgi:hypothetical protein
LQIPEEVLRMVVVVVVVVMEMPLQRMGEILFVAVLAAVVVVVQFRV